MSRNASITLTWADGDYVFRLAWGQLSQLQEQCDAGPYVILQRLMDGGWKMKDISEVIRFGLIGGGMEPIRALKLVRAYVEDRPPMESLMVAQAVLTAGVIGAPEEDVAKKKDPETGSESILSPTVGSA